MNRALTALTVVLVGLFLLLRLLDESVGAVWVQWVIPVTLMTTAAVVAGQHRRSG